MTDLTPRQIVRELDKYIVGQDDAKRSVAIALRNRWRRHRLDDEMRNEVMPKNLLMIGPTGVGKTEIARRLAGLVRAPFVKVEATKYTEVGYVGRDVESMVRDLMENAVHMVRIEMREKVRDKATQAAKNRVLFLLEPALEPVGSSPFGYDPDEDEPEFEQSEQLQRIKEKTLARLEAGKLDDKVVRIVTSDSQFNVEFMFQGMGMDEIAGNLQDMFEDHMPKKTRERSVTVREAMEILTNEEMDKMVDLDSVVQKATRLAEQHGLIFIDELDKIAGPDQAGAGPDVSREGVQRDILPLVEGTTVNTKYGMLKTDHILFIGAGAFHVAKPSDLIPELQGRFPLRVELSALSMEDFVKILTEPKNALVKQYMALLEADGVKVKFTKSGVKEIASISCEVNDSTENIGARRLHTIMEKVLELVLFGAPEEFQGTLTVDKKFVHERLADTVRDQDLSRYIL